MSERVTGRSRGYRLVRLAVVLLVFVGLTAYGCYRYVNWPATPSGARRIADAVTVTGFVRAAVVDQSDGDSPPYAQAFFIGPPPKPDPIRDVSVPTIRLAVADPPPAAPEWDKSKYVGVDFPVARGQRPDGCGSTVTFVANPKQSVRSLRGNTMISILTDAQLAAVRKGTDILVEVDVANCGW
jgi:hypothetical protein